jgi:hypothetical protein
VGQDIGFDAVVDHFTLDADEIALLRNKADETRLGFAVQLKFLLWRGRFPKGRSEIPDDALAHVGRQTGVAASAFGLYDLSGRSAKRHRTEIREACRFRKCSVGDADKLVGWLAENVTRAERREEQVTAELTARCRHERIEPPTPERTQRIVRSALRTGEDALFAQTLARLRHGGADVRLAGLAEHGRDFDDADDETDPDLLAQFKADPGNVSLETMRIETRKLLAIRALDLPPDVFAGVAPKVVAMWRARAAVESPSHLRAHDDRVKASLLAALVHLRQREITDTLVELFNFVVHRVGARAERKVTEQLTNAFKRVNGKEGILFAIARACVEQPDAAVREAVFPAILGGEQTLKDLVHEFKTKGPVYRQIVQTTLKASYTNHYRRGLMDLVAALGLAEK